MQTRKRSTVNERILDNIIRHQIDLTRYANGVVRDVMRLLRSADDDLFVQLNIALSRASEGSFSVRRLDELMQGVSALNDRVYAAVHQAVRGAANELVEYELGHQQQMFESVLPSAVKVNAPSFYQALASVEARPFQGQLLSEWFEQLPSNAQRRIASTVRMGFVEGKTIDEMVREVRGTKSQNYKDGIINIDRRHAESVVRTAVSQTAAVAREEFYAANEDLIKEEQWVSTLDNRTTEECQIRDGKRYTCPEHQPIGHAVPWGAGPGAIHWGCRSTALPIVHAADELGLDLPPAERAMMNGVAPGDLTFQQWIEQQSASVQDEILGPTRGQLMRAGKMRFERFFNREGEFLTLDELREKDRKAFKRAGL